MSRSAAAALGALTATAVWSAMPWVDICRLNAISLFSVDAVAIYMSCALIFGPPVLLPALLGIAALHRWRPALLGDRNEHAAWLAAAAVGVPYMLLFVYTILRAYGVYFLDYPVELHFWSAAALQALRAAAGIAFTALVFVGSRWLGRALAGRLDDRGVTGSRALPVHGLAYVGVVVAAYMAILTLHGIYMGGHPAQRLAAFVLGTSSPEREGAAYDGPQVSPRKKLVLLGLDALDYRQIHMLQAQGELPNLSRLFDEGRHGPLDTIKPTNSPLIWNVMATGVMPEQHGVKGYITYRFAGTDDDNFVPLARGMNWLFNFIDRRTGLLGSVPVLADERTEPAIWEVVDMHGGTSAVVNWWPSRPVDRVQGWMVSDYGLRSLSKNTAQTPMPCKLDAVDAQPADLCDDLLAGGALDDVPTDYCPTDWWAADERPSSKAQSLQCWPAKDAVALSIGSYLYDTHRPDFTAVYTHAADFHYHYDTFEPQYYRAPDFDGPFANEVQNRMISIDHVVGQWMDAIDEDTVLMVISDHGLHPVLWENGFDKTGSHVNEPPGVLALWGEGIEPGALSDAQMIDVYPTMLAVMGLPLPGNRPGKPLVDEHVERIADYGPRVRAAASGPTEDQSEFLDELEALGYME